MRVLAVAEVGDLLERAHEQRREALLALARTSARSRCRSARCRRTPRPRAPRAWQATAAARRRAARRARVVARGVDDHRAEGEVLRRRADHRRAADVDVLDHLGLGHVRAGRRSARTGTGSRTRGRRTRSPARRPPAGAQASSRTGQQAGVELGVQRLDPAVHDLGEAGEVGDRADREPAPPRARRAVPPVETSSTPSSASPRAKSTMPALVGDRDQARGGPALPRARSARSRCVSAIEGNR